MELSRERQRDLHDIQSMKIVIGKIEEDIDRLKNKEIEV